jgi:hypothetical protein
MKKKKNKVGRPKNIETPEIMWELFQQYKKDIKANPFLVKDWVGGMGKMVMREKEKPLTLEGFNVWCFENGIASWLHDYFMNKDNRYAEFANICSIIKEQIRQDQIGGGMAGIYNPSITQRLNNLVEKTENKHEVSEIKITHDR